jgi:LmbE family N-acetylglucosaminyl deacetylase
MAENNAMRQLLDPNAYPYFLPHLNRQLEGVYLGSLKVAELSDAALAFSTSCDGRTAFRDFPDRDHGYEELGLLQDYILWLDEPLDAPTERQPGADTCLILSPHPHVGLLSMGGFMLNHRGLVDWTQAVCFSRVSATIFPEAFATVQEVSAIRRDEASICSILTGCRTEYFDLPAYELRKISAADMFQRNEDDFRNLLKLDLYQLISDRKPLRVYAPAGIGEHPDHRLLFEIVLDFFKQDYFPKTEFHLYEDFPFAVSYLNVDDFLSGFESACVDTESWNEDISRVLESKCRLLDIFKSLFPETDKQLVREVARRNDLVGRNLSGSTPPGGAERFWRLKDLNAERS